MLSSILHSLFKSLNSKLHYVSLVGYHCFKPFALQKGYMKGGSHINILNHGPRQWRVTVNMCHKIQTLALCHVRRSICLINQFQLNGTTCTTCSVHEAGDLHHLLSTKQFMILHKKDRYKVNTVFAFQFYFFLSLLITISEKIIK